MESTDTATQAEQLPRSLGGDLPITRRCHGGQHARCPGSWTQYPDEGGPCECGCHGPAANLPSDEYLTPEETRDGDDSGAIPMASLPGVGSDPDGEYPTPAEIAARNVDAEPISVERVFTFGYGHTDPDTDEILVHQYVTVIAVTAERARAVMFAVFGNAWAFEYASAEAAQAPGCPPLREHARIDLLAGAR